MDKGIAKPSYFKAHVVAWSLFIAYEVLMLFSLTGKFNHPLDYVTHYALNISFFYINAHLVLAELDKGERSRWWRFLLFLIAEAAGYYLIKFGIVQLSQYLALKDARPYTTFRRFLIETIWRFIYFMGLSLAYWFALRIIRKNKEISRISEETLRIENSFLRSQINPHFLFNTLSFLYNRIKKLSPDLAETVMQLSDMMRFAVKPESADGLVDIEEELEQVENLIALNQTRFNNELQLSFKARGSGKGHKIIPLVMLTLTENVFKYAELQNPEKPARISVDLTPDLFRFETTNYRKTQDSKNSEGGVGLQNLRKRLKNQYGPDCTFEITDDEQFSVLLTINY